MKVLALVLAAVATVSAQSEPWCRCAAFTTYQDSETMVWEGQEITVDSCDNSKQCKNQCTMQLNVLSNYGDLWSKTAAGITVGQHICDSLVGLHHGHVHNHYVYGYYEMCGGAWEYTGLRSEQMLCCNKGEHIHCISESME